MFSNLIVVHGFIYVSGFAMIILISVLVNPRIWMQDFPNELKKLIPPKSNNERRQTLITGFLFAVFIIGFPFFSVSVKLGTIKDIPQFKELFLHSFYIMMICNTIYWIILDLLIFNIVINRIRTIQRIKKMFRFRGWKRQIFGLLVGSAMCGIISGIVAWITTLII